ncbi:MAG: hydantoinase B/oxoprolinase family protein [Thaumarchaeota archaeon]|nr:hydantoinase B/oxoprolinase family protein [Nitrososphaerota archaeon]
MNPARTGKVDPITLEVIRGGIVALCQEMGILMERSSFSPVFSEGLDYSFALFDGGGEMVSQAAFDPCHLGAMPQTVAKSLEIVGLQNLRPGDVILNNDPYLGGSHISDYTFIRPIFHGERIVAMTAARAHMIDVGASVPGSFAGDTTDIHQEGLRLPAVKIVSQGNEVSDLWRLILTNVRVSQAFQGDMRAVLGALKVAERRVIEYVQKYGPDTWDSTLANIKDVSEAVVRRELRKLPEGSYLYEDYVDDSGFSGDALRLRVRVTLKDGNLVADYSGSSKQARGPINAALSVTLGNTYIGTLHCLPIHGEYQLNSGTFRPIRAITLPGTLLHPVYPAPVQGGNTETSNRIADVLIGALSQAVPPENVKAACHGTDYGMTGGGVNQMTGEEWVMYLWALGGMGARFGRDGNPAQLPFATNNKGPVVEVQETRYPLITLKYQLSQPDSCGAGKSRGGMGTVCEWRLANPEAELSALSERHKISPYGVFGGLPPGSLSCGHFSDTRITPKGARAFSHATELFGMKSPSKWAKVTLRDGDIIEMIESGGGGYGNPLERDPKKVASDVLYRYISLEAAEKLYGVVLDGNHEADVKATDSLRARIIKGEVPLGDLVVDGTRVVAWLICSTEAAAGAVLEESKSVDGIKKVVLELGNTFSYAKALAKSRASIYNLARRLPEGSVRVHTIQYFAPDATIEKFY